MWKEEDAQVSGSEVKECVEGLPRCRGWGPSRRESVELERFPRVQGVGTPRPWPGLLEGSEREL